MKTDIHNHAMPERALALLRDDPGYGVTLSGRRWQGGMHVDFKIAPSFTDPEAKLAELDAKGLERAVVSVAPPLFYYHVERGPGERMAAAVNLGLAEFCEAAPERLRWLASVALQHPEGAAAELERAVAMGCLGVEIGTAVAGGRRLDAEEFEPFWAAAERLGVPVTLHPAYGTPNSSLADFYFENVLGFLFETTVAIERLICAGTLDRHPDLEIVLLHGGGYFPYQAGRLRHARTVRPELAGSPEDPWGYLDRLWFDTITHDVAALEHLVHRVGLDRVVMGTDLPFDMASPAPLDALVAATDEELARRVTEENPSRLYPGLPAR